MLGGKEPGKVVREQAVVWVPAAMRGAQWGRGRRAMNLCGGGDLNEACSLQAASLTRSQHRSLFISMRKLACGR